MLLPLVFLYPNTGYFGWQLGTSEPSLLLSVTRSAESYTGAIGPHSLALAGGVLRAAPSICSPASGGCIVSCLNNNAPPTEPA
jgi:hypothetical protein